MTRARDLANSTPGTTGQPFAMASGDANSGGTGIVSITYPSGRFTQTPRLLVTGNTNPNNGAVVMFYGNSTTGATIYFSVGYAGVNWVAIQMTSGAASG